MRAPAAGRNWEGYVTDGMFFTKAGGSQVCRAGGDPFLSGEMAFETVAGIQSTGVQAVAKHYINNEQEHARDSGSSNVDDR